VKKLTEEERSIIEEKGTEAPYSGEYEDFFEEGKYSCKKCGALLFRSEDKFDAKCGWPSFDNNEEEAIKRIVDEDGARTEIQCAQCRAHLGHVFEGEGMIEKDVRYCVNSLSLEFKAAKNE